VSNFGNSYQQIQYTTNGEAGDWFTHKGIINLEVELGNLDKRSDDFYPPRRLHFDILKYNLLPFTKFFYFHVPKFEAQHFIKRDKYNMLIQNRSLSQFSDRLMHLNLYNDRGQEI